MITIKTDVHLDDLQEMLKYALMQDMTSLDNRSINIVDCCLQTIRSMGIEAFCEYDDEPLASLPESMQEIFTDEIRDLIQDDLIQDIYFGNISTFSRTVDIDVEFDIDIERVLEDIRLKTGLRDNNRER